MVNVKMAKRGAITIPKFLREAYGMQLCDVFALVDLGGLFVLGPRRFEIDAIADSIAQQWTDNGETSETMLRALRNDRNQDGE